MRDTSFGRWLLITLYLASFAVVAFLFVRAAPYYATPLRERAHHEGYWDYKAGGRVGHSLGIAGSTMLLLMLLYSVRKRVPALRRVGPLGGWLDGHIYLGVFGPLLVVLHSAFKVQGLVALSFWSMVLVASSGVLGRYLYLQIPRTRAGEELALADLERQDRELTALLRTRFGLGEEQLTALDSVGGSAAPAGILGGLVGIVVGDLRLRSAVRRFAAGCRSVPPGVFREFERVVRQKAIARRRIRLWNRLHSLFHYWHVLHKPFAVVMYVFLAVHVAVALATGYGWGPLS